eukprot:1689619-Amphidinium_carterae.1
MAFRPPPRHGSAAKVIYRANAPSYRAAGVNATAAPASVPQKQVPAAHVIPAAASQPGEKKLNSQTRTCLVLGPPEPPQKNRTPKK